MKAEFCILLIAVLTCSVAVHDNEKQLVEARGKAKYALLMHFFYVVATKLFVLKIIYGGIFYALIIKGWHFVSWFIHYLKEKKHNHHEFVEYDHGPSYHDHGHYHDHYVPDHNGHDHYGPDHNGHSHYDNGHYDPVSYASDSYGPYAYEKQGYGYKKAYDADGSYSVKS